MTVRVEWSACRTRQIELGKRSWVQRDVLDGSGRCPMGDSVEAAICLEIAFCFQEKL